MQKKRWVFIYILFLFVVWNRTILATEITDHVYLNDSQKVYSDDLIIRSNGILQFNRNIEIEVQGDAIIEGTLKSRVSNGGNRSTAATGTQGSKGTSTSWAGGDGGTGYNGRDGGDGSNGYNLILNIEGRLELRGTISSNGGDGGDGGRGGQGGKGGNGYSGEYHTESNGEPTPCDIEIYITYPGSPDGGTGGRGGTGGDAGRGGNGGNITITAKEIIIEDDGIIESRRGGNGGRGSGGSGGDGGDGGTVRVYIDGNHSHNITGSDGGTLGSGGVGDNCSGSARGGSIILITPLLDVPQGYSLSNIKYYTDEGKPVINLEFKDFDNYVQSGPDPRVIIKVRDQGCVKNIQGVDKQIGPSGIEKVSIILDGKVVKEVPIQYGQNEDLGKEKTFEFSLKDYSSGEHTIQIKAVQRNKMTDNTTTTSETYDFLLTNVPEQVDDNFTHELKADGTLHIRWNEFYVPDGDIQYKYKLYQDNSYSDTLLAQSAAWSYSPTIDYNPYPYETRLYFYVKARNSSGMETDWIKYDSFLTEAQPPQIINCYASSTYTSETFTGILTMGNMTTENKRFYIKVYESGQSDPIITTYFYASSVSPDYQVTGLKPHKYYTFRVWSVNEEGKIGSIYDQVGLRVPNRSPIKPEDLQAFPMGVSNPEKFSIKQFFDPDGDEVKYYLTVEEYNPATKSYSIVNGYNNVLMNINYDGTVTYDASNLVHGKKYRWKVKVIDYWSGGSGTPKVLGPFNIEVDKVPPTFSIDYPGFVNEYKVQFTFIKDSDVKRIDLKFNDNTIKNINLSTYTLYLPQQNSTLEGYYNGNFIAYDEANNSTSVNFTVKLDMVAPVKPVFKDLSQFIFDESSIKVVWSCAGDNPGGSGLAGYKIRWNRGTIHDSSNNYYTISNLKPNEDILVEVCSVDSAGNMSSYVSCIVGTSPVFSDEVGYFVTPGYEYNDGIYKLYMDYKVNARADQYRINKGNQFGEWKTTDQSTRIYVTPHETYNIEIELRNTFKPFFDSGTVAVKNVKTVSQTVPNNPPGYPVNTMPNYVNTLNPVLSYELTMPDIDGDPLRVIYEVKSEDGTIVQVSSLEEINFIEGEKYYYRVGIKDDYMKDYRYSEWTWFVIDCTPPTVAITPEYNGEWVKELNISILTIDDAQAEPDKNSGASAVAYSWNSPPQETDWQSGPAVYNVSVPVGINSLYVKTKDTVGNIGEKVYAGYFKVDVTEPVITNLHFVESKVINGQKYGNIPDQVQFNFNIEEEESGLEYLGYALISEDEYTYYQNLSNDRFKEINLSNKYKGYYTCVANQLLEENVKYYIVIKARNRADIETYVISSETIIIDTTPPAITSVNITGTITDGEYHYIKDFSEFKVNPICTESDVSYKYGLSVDSLSEGEVDSEFYNLDFTQIQAGESFYLKIKAIDSLNNYTIKTVGPFIFDNTQPIIEDVKLGSYPDYVENYVQRDNTRLMIGWNVDDEIPLSQLQYAIGTTPGGQEISKTLKEADTNGWIKVLPSKGSSSIILEGLELANGDYYLTVRAENILGLVTFKSSTPLRIEKSSIPEPIVLTGRVSSIANGINFKVLHPDYNNIAYYEYKIMDERGTEIVSGVWNEVSKTSEETAVIVDLGENILKAGITYYVEVKGVMNDGETPLGYSNGLIIDLTPPVVEGLINEGYISGDLVVLNYKIIEDYSEVNANDVEIKVGTTPENGDITGGWIKANSLMGIDFYGTKFSDGQRYFISLRVSNTAGLEANVYGSFIYDNSKPPIPVVIDGCKYSLPTDKIKINFEPTEIDAHSGLDHFEYAITMERSAIGLTDWKVITESDLEKIDMDGDGILDTEINALWIQHDAILEHGNTYYVAIKAVNKAGLYSVGFSDGLIIDNDAPSSMEVTVNDHWIVELDSQIVANFKAIENVSEIENYVYWVGTYDNEYKVLGQRKTEDNSVTITGYFEQGDWIYVRGTAENSVGLISHQGISNGILIDAKSPEINWVKVGFTQFSDETQSISFYWDAIPSEVPIVRYNYLFTKDPNGTYGLSGETNSESITFTGPFENGKTYYLFVSAVDEKGFVSNVIKSEGVLVALPPLRPVILDTGLYKSPDNLTFSWSRSAEDVIGGYRWAIGSFMGDDDITGGWIYINEDTVDDWDNLKELLTISIDASEYADLMEHDKNYYFKVEACNPYGQYSKTSIFNFKLDKTLPEKPVVSYQGYTGDSEVLETLYTTDANCIHDLMVSSKDKETGIIRYRYQIVGDTKGVIYTYTVPADETFSFNAESEETLTEGGTYYVAVSVQNGVGDWSEYGYSPPIVVDTIPPTIGFVNSSNLVTNGEARSIIWTTDEIGEAVITLKLPENHPDWDMIPQSIKRTITTTGEQIFEFIETTYGIYELIIEQYDRAGNKSAVIKKEIRVNHPPIVTINQIDRVYQGRSVNFYIVSCYDPDYVSENDPEGLYAIKDYNWKLNGTTVSITDTAQYTFNDKGIYEMVLEVVDVDGGVGVDKTDFSVINTLSGELVIDEVWEEDIVLEGTVIVPEGIKLTIVPGVHAKFPEQTGLEINGSIDAKGLSDSPICISGGDLEEMWNGVTIRSTNESSLQSIDLKYLEITNAFRGLSLLDFPGGLVLDSLSFRNNQMGLHLYNTNPELRFCSFIDNRYYGIKEDGNSKSNLVECYFSGNGAAPLYDEEGTLMKLEELDIRSFE